MAVVQREVGTVPEGDMDVGTLDEPEPAFPDLPISASMDHPMRSLKTTPVTIPWSPVPSLPSESATLPALSKALESLRLVNMQQQIAFEEFEQLQSSRRHDLRKEQSKAFEECITAAVSIIRPHV